MTTEDWIKEALDFEEKQKSYVSRNDKIIAASKAKEIILALNEVYKETKEESLMDLMKRLTVIKRKLEKRLKGRSA